MLFVHLPRMEQLIMGQSDHVHAVGARLRRLIRALGIKQVDAAGDMQVTKNKLNNWLRGRSYPLHYELYRFCRIRGVSADYVLLGDPSGLKGWVLEALIKLELEPEAAEEADHPEAENHADA